MASQVAVSSVISLDSVRTQMLRPVNFYHQINLRRVEIHDMIPDGPLSIKLNPLNLLPPRFLP